MRLDRYFSELGFSRSEMKKEINHKKVKVNGVIVTDNSFNVTENDEITYKDEKIVYEKFVYYILNKPAGYVSARVDKLSKTVLELIDDMHDDLSPVGRLDKDTEGLLLITNDGEFLHNLMSPKKHVSKKYFAEIEGVVTEDDIKKFKEGLDIGDEKNAASANLEILETNDNSSKIVVEIFEGRYHEVKRLFEAVGKKVTYLKRISIGNLELPSDLELGQSIKVSKEDLINKIYN